MERGTEVLESRQTFPIRSESIIYGRDEDREKIVEFLLRHASDCDDLSIYSIFGIGGFGKTTLAQLVYHDEQVKKHFELFIWVHVSGNFEVKRILQSIIEFTSKQRCNFLDLDPIQKQIKKLLQSKKYLLVLDDIWNEDEKEWDKLKHVLACGSKGASILVTTCVMRAASIVVTFSIHCLFLSFLFEECLWLLFKQHAFGSPREKCAEFVAIGKEIVKKCLGLPIAVKAIGGLLHFKSEKKEWLDVRDSEIWNLSDDESSILPALKLSYSDLPIQLRQCFVNCAIFPRDEIIEMKLLIHHWMANGFISSQGGLSIEDVGSEIWNELYQRSFFQDIYVDEFGQVKNFKMHDLVHDLAEYARRKECLVLGDVALTNLSRSTHHIGWSYSNRTFDLDGLRIVEYSKTLLSGSYWGSLEFSAFHSARAGISSNFLKNFIHLRYLDLSNTNIKILPKSICSLQKLETLKLEHCFNVLRLPEHLRCLKNLKHLLIRRCYSLSQTPPRIRELTCLKSLSIFIVGTEEGYRIAEIRDLELAGEIHIKGLENIASALDAGDANLIAKKYLHGLQLSWRRKVEKESFIGDDQQVLEALQPYSNLRSLIIEGYLGVQFPNWMSNIANFASLVSLRLFECKNCQQLPPLGKLPSLRSLKIYGMKYVQYIDDESYDGVAFMSLETLEVRKLPNLESFLKEERIEMFPRLSELFIDVGPRFRLPYIPSVKCLFINGFRDKMLWSISNYRNLTSLGEPELTCL